MFSQYSNTCTEQTSKMNGPPELLHHTGVRRTKKRKTEERLGYDYYGTTTEVCDTF